MIHLLKNYSFFYKSELKLVNIILSLQMNQCISHTCTHIHMQEEADYSIVILEV